MQEDNDTKMSLSVEDNGFRCSLESTEDGVVVPQGDSYCVEEHRGEKRGDPCGLAKLR